LRAPITPHPILAPISPSQFPPVASFACIVVISQLETDSEALGKRYRRVLKKVGFRLRRRDFVFSIIHKLGYVGFHSIYRIQVEGKKNIPGGPAIILPKHQFWTDIPMIGLTLGKPASYVAKHELFMYPLVREFLTWLGGIPINRMDPVKSLSSFRYVENLLKRGEKIILFPEGTYYPNSLGPGKHGFIQAILHFQKGMKSVPGGAIPFIPMGICYEEGRGRTRVRVRIGTPLISRDESEAREFTGRIVEEIGRLSGIQ
jgi:1-acyl-sn-glycerol-3-phosphate acyltransferase